MHKPEPHKILRDVRIKTNPQIPASRPYLIWINKNQSIFASWLKNKNVRRRKAVQIPGSCQRADKAVEHEGDSDTNRSWNTWNSLQKPGN